MSFFTGHRTIFVCDIVAFSAPDRTDDVQRHLRRELRARLAPAFDASGIPFADCYTEDRGDGLLLVAPPAVRAGTLVSPLADRIDAELRRQHAIASPTARLRLRAAVHSGEVYQDEHGLVGRSVIDAFRLLEAPTFKRRIAETTARLALIISDHLFQTVVLQDPDGLSDPAVFTQMPVALKETKTTAWTRLFGIPTLISRPATPDGNLSETRTQLALARELLALPTLRTAAARTAVVNSLPPQITVSRQPEPLLDTLCIIKACLEYPNGIPILFTLLHTS